MTTSVARAFVCLLLGSILVVGCSGTAGDTAADDTGAGDSTGSGPGSGPGNEPSRTATGSPGPVDGAVGSEGCSLDREQLSFVVRDWGRVFGSIGRGDHSTYTGAFATRLSRTQAAAGGCNGSAELADFLAAVRQIDARSRRPTPSYSLYDAAGTSGNAWLAKVGYGNNALSVG